MKKAILITMLVSSILLTSCSLEKESNENTNLDKANKVVKDLTNKKRELDMEKAKEALKSLRKDEKRVKIKAEKELKIDSILEKLSLDKNDEIIKFLNDRGILLEKINIGSKVKYSINRSDYGKLGNYRFLSPFINNYLNKGSKEEIEFEYKGQNFVAVLDQDNPLIIKELDIKKQITDKEGKVTEKVIKKIPYNKSFLTLVK